MPSLTEHQSSKIVKMLLMGDSGAGKTGALTSLVKAGFKLRILDMDNGLDSLATYVKRECPDKLANVEYCTLRDSYRASPVGPILDGPPKAFVTAINLLDKWKVGDKDLGVPASWGPECILVLDSLTFFSDAAFDWATTFKPSKDPRQIYGEAQNAVEHVLALLSGVSFNTNVIVIAHIKFLDMPDGTVRGYPTAVGKALSPTIPRYFNATAMCRTSTGGKREIVTVSTALVDLKNPASFKMTGVLPIETGLATFFQTLKG